MRSMGLAAVALAIGMSVPAFGQDCLPGQRQMSDRDKDAIRAARLVNTLEANQPGARTQAYLSQEELQTLVDQQRARAPKDAFVNRVNLSPGADVLPGWQLTLGVTKAGYWFMIKDKTDRCGFSLISNQDGVIYTAQPIH